MPTRGALPTLVWVAWMVGGVHAGGEDPAVAAARARQAAVRTLEVQFTRIERVARGGLTTLRTAPRPPLTLAPSRDLTLLSGNRLVLDGVKLRYESNHPRLESNDQTIRKSDVCWFDGTTAVRFFPAGIAYGESPVAILDPGEPPSAWGDITLLPLWLAFREARLPPGMYSIRAVRPTGGSTQLDGRSCLEYAGTSGADRATRFWLDPGRDHAVRRLRCEKPNQPIFQLDVSLRRHAVGGWVPASWVQTWRMPDGRLLSTTEVQVAELRINEPLAPGLFDLRLPPGTMVEDHRGARGEHREYVVQPDGSWRPAATSSPDPAREFPPDPRAVWPLAGLCGLIIACVALQYAWRRRYRHTGVDRSEVALPSATPRRGEPPG